MAQLSDLITKVKYNIGGRTDKDAAITFALNMAVDDVANSADWPDLLTHGTTVNLAYGSYMVAKPTTHRKVFNIRLSDSNQNYFNIQILGKERFRELVSNFIPTNYALPSYCYIEGATIYFDSMADQAYTVRYDGYLYPTAMSATSDTPSITGFDEVLVAQATGYVFASLKQVDMASFWFALATSKLQDKLDETRISAVGQVQPW